MSERFPRNFNHPIGRPDVDDRLEMPARPKAAATRSPANASPTRRVVRDCQGARLRYRIARRIEPRAALKIRGNQIVGTSASANIDLGGSGTDQIAIAIERVEEPQLIGAGIRLNSPQCIFRYEK